MLMQSNAHWAGQVSIPQEAFILMQGLRQICLPHLGHREPFDDLVMHAQVLLGDNTAVGRVRECKQRALFRWILFLLMLMIWCLIIGITLSSFSPCIGFLLDVFKDWKLCCSWSPLDIQGLLNLRTFAVAISTLFGLPVVVWVCVFVNSLHFY